MVCFNFPPVKLPPELVSADSASPFNRSNASCIHALSTIQPPKTRVGPLRSAFCRPRSLVSLNHIARCNLPTNKDGELSTQNGNGYSKLHLVCPISACDENPEADESSSQFAYILGTFISAISGGYTLSISSLVFYWLGRLAEAPPWICTIAALLSAALLDILVYNSFITIPFLGRPSLLPYILFTATFVTSAVFDFDAVFRTVTPGTSVAKLREESDSVTIASRENVDINKQIDDEMTQWDQRMMRGRTETEEGSDQQVTGSD